MVYIDSSHVAVENKKVFAAQYRELLNQDINGSYVTCRCGLKIRLYHAFKCYYCFIWFCAKCAEKHFEVSK